MSGPLSVDQVKVLLQYLQYASRFPDFPKNFTPPKLVDPTYIAPNKSDQLLIPCYITLALSVIIVAARIWVRAGWNGYNIGWDDWVMLMALVAGIGMSAVNILLVEIGGVGQHIFDISVDAIAKSQQLAFANVQVYILAVFLIKISICLFIKRLIAGLYPGPSRVADMLMVFFAVISVTSSFLIFFACTPVAAAWDVLLRISRPTQCLNMTKLIRGLNVIYSVGDWLLLFLPIYVIWKLQLSLERRIAISVVLAIGGLACAISIVRLFFVQGAYNSFDPTWNGLLACLWNQLEITLGIITGSLPALSVFLVRALDTMISAISSSGVAIANSLYIFRNGKSTSWETDMADYEHHASGDYNLDNHHMRDRDCHSQTVRIKRDTVFEFTSEKLTKDGLSPTVVGTGSRNGSRNITRAFFDSKALSQTTDSMSPSLRTSPTSDHTLESSTDWDLIIQTP